MAVRILKNFINKDESITRRYYQDYTHNSGPTADTTLLKVLNSKVSLLDNKIGKMSRTSNIIHSQNQTIQAQIKKIQAQINRTQNNNRSYIGTRNVNYIENIASRNTDNYNDMNNIPKKEVQKSIDENFTVNANSSYTSSIVPNPGFSTAKLMANIRFTSAHTAGLTIDLYYGSSRIGEVLSVTNTRGVNHASEPFDVQYLDGFNFVINNKDTTSNTLINNLRIVLYND